MIGKDDRFSGRQSSRGEFLTAPTMPPASRWRGVQGCSDLKGVRLIKTIRWTAQAILFLLKGGGRRTSRLLSRYKRRGRELSEVTASQSGKVVSAEWRGGVAVAGRWFSSIKELT